MEKARRETPKVLGAPSTLAKESGPNWAFKQQGKSDVSVPEEEREAPLGGGENMSSVESSESYIG